MKFLESFANPRCHFHQLLKRANRFRNTALLLLALLLTTPLILFVVSVRGQGGGSPLLISEFRVRGPNGANDEFIEIYNNSGIVSPRATDGKRSEGRVVSRSDRFVADSRKSI
jgi:hypothetical protein